MNSEQTKQQNILLYLLLMFYIVFLICAILLQIRSGESPSTSGTVFDKFTGSLFWVLSITSLLFAAIRFDTKPKFFLWLLVSAGAGALAIDEIFEFHEETRHLIEDDDYIKMSTLIIAVVGSYILYIAEKPTRKIIIVFLTGLLFHTLYIIVDMGDGDFFTLPIPLDALRWIEEILETLSLQGYLAGFLLHYSLISRSTDQ